MRTGTERSIPGGHPRAWGVGGTGTARALRWSCRGSPGVAPLLGYGAPPRGSEDPATGSGRGVFGGSHRRSVELSGASLLPPHEIWSLDGFAVGEAVVTPVTPGDPGPDVTPGMRHIWGCQGARASPGARACDAFIPWECCHGDAVFWGPLCRGGCGPPCAPQGSRCRTWQDPLGCTSCKALLGFEGEASDSCQPLQRGLGGVSCDTHSPAGSGCGSRVVKGLTLPFFTPLPFCPLGH